MGINTAGRIVEIASGQPFADFMQSHLMGPLGMKDTTFWPNSNQLMRLAKAYRPTPTNDTLMEIEIDQLTRPYDNPKRTPMPAGGYFSTAIDVLRFGQMLLNGGVFEGRRYLSQNSMAELTRNQLPEGVQGSYSIGFAIDPDNFGHGGALATNFKVSHEHGITMAYLIQHGGFLHDGGKIVETVWKTAVETFGRKR
jgi:CubicO group peptidase (beta-lactamase class C family)